MKMYTHVLVLTSVVLLAIVSDCAALMNDVRLQEPSILLEERRPAKIPCLIKGKHDAYIWMKGNSVENSTVIASFIDGIASEDNWPFAVSENGTLLIEKVRLKDEGKYFCRASSVISECSGDVLTHVQANLDKFELGVDRCHLQRDCVIFIDPLHANTITCTATNAPHSMHLKWFNGSKEILDGIVSRIRDVQGGLSRDISSTLNVVDAHPSSLTCQAVDQNRLNDEGLFVNVLLKAPVTSTKPSPVWMVIVIILLVICMVAVAAIVIMTVRSKKKRHKALEGQENGEHNPLLEKEKEISEKLKAEIQSLKDKQESDEKEKFQMRQRLKEHENDILEKNTQIQRLQAKQENDEKIKDEIIQRLKTKQENDIKEKDEEINRLKAQKRDDMSEKDAELLRLKAKQEGGVKEKDVEIKRLKAKQDIDISEKDTEIQKLKAKLEKEVKERDAEIDRLKKTVIKEKDFEFQALKAKQLNEVKERDAEIRRLKHTLMEKEESIRKLLSSIKESEKNEETIKKLKGELLETTNQLKDTLITLKKFQCNEEDKERKLRMDKMKLKDTLQLACKIISDPGGKEQIKQIKTNLGITVKLKDSVKTANFNLAYTTKANSEEVSQAVCDLTQNAIDGGTSCIISYAASGQDHMVTMTGSFDGRNEGLIMVSCQQLFATAVSLEEKGIEVKLSVRYIIGKSASRKDTSQDIFVDYLSEGEKPTKISEVKEKKVHDIQNEKETLRRYLMHLKGEKSSKTSEVGMVEYSIVTFVDNIERSSGKISFIALCGLEQLSQCFESDSSSASELVQTVSKTIYDENCYSILITHLHAGKKEDSKRTLEFLQKVQTEKRGIFKKLLQSLQKSDDPPSNPEPTPHPGMDKSHKDYRTCNEDNKKK